MDGTVAWVYLAGVVVLVLVVVLFAFKRSRF
jgi:hypothetical protein